MDTDTGTICKELAAIGKSLRVIGQILETGALVESKRASNGAYDEPAKKTATKKATTTEDTTEETTTISAKTIAAKANGKKTAKTEEDESFDLGDEETATGETPAVTKKDLIAACRENREAAIKVLKKLKVSSVHELKPAQYATVLQQIGAN